MTFATHFVPVRDGKLTVAEWADGKRPLLAIHGLSSTHKLWLWTVASLKGYHVIAPDLRGRGGSQGFRDYGMRHNRDDMIAVLDHFGLDKVTLLGMSLGGFIAADLAAAHPKRIDRLMLVDGGIPFANAAAMKKMSREQIVGSFADRFGRIERPWPSYEAYRDFFLGATGPLLDRDDPLLEEYLRYDLVGAEPELRVRLDGAAMAADSADLYLDGRADEAAAKVKAPTRLLYAQWSIGRDSPPGYTGEYLQPWLPRIRAFKATLLPGTDHAATVMSDASGQAIARELDILAHLPD
ncbi:MAG TPA: alpha/beta hydrolase [Candidatus Dormibacteraeota bacterium]|nr:alpha/beta hydrolase [Candidatus Dormibacteraeota bacterium]